MLVDLMEEYNVQRPNDYIFRLTSNSLLNNVSPSTIRNWYISYLRTGTTSGNRHRTSRRNRVVKPENFEYILKLNAIDNSLYYDEYADLIFKEFNVLYTSDQIQKECTKDLYEHRFTNKKLSKRAIERDNILDEMFNIAVLDNMDVIPARNYVILHEMSLQADHVQRTRGNSPKGIPSFNELFFGHPDNGNMSCISAITIEGCIAVKALKLNTAETFIDFFENHILIHCNAIGPRSVILLDSARVHNKDLIEMLCYEKGVRVVYFPPYEPWKNPIEFTNGNVRSYIHRNYFNITKFDNLANILETSFKASATPEKTIQFFNHCGLTITADDIAYINRTSN